MSKQASNAAAASSLTVSISSTSHQTGQSNTAKGGASNGASSLLTSSSAVGSAEASSSSSGLVKEVDAGDVVRLMLQFMKEQKLTHSFQTLQEESGVFLNTVESLEGFRSDMKYGRWDTVLSQVSTLKVPPDKLFDLYEQVYVEMLERREMDTAQALLLKTLPMKLMREEQPSRYKRLKSLLAVRNCDEKDLYPEGSNKQKRRTDIADALAEEVTVVPPSRLMSVIGQSLKWQQHVGALPHGSKLDLLTGARAKRKDESEKCPTRSAGKIIFEDDSDTFAQSAIFTPDGERLVTGSVDGFIELWDTDRFKLDISLSYQKNNELLMHENEKPILALAISKDSELLASGDADGQVKVWHLSTGKLLRGFPKAHTEGVCSMQFSRDGTHLLTGSYDGTARIHGLRSGSTLKTFSGHSSYVNEACYSADGSQVYTGSSDGTIKVWDVRTSECIQTITPPQDAHTAELPVMCVRPVPRTAGQIVVVNRSNKVHILSSSGQVVKTLNAEMGATKEAKKFKQLEASKAVSSASDSAKQLKKRNERQSQPGVEEGHFTACTVTPRGKWIYALGTDNYMYCFSFATGNLEHTIHVSEAMPLGIAHHPVHNLVATYSQENLLRLWKP